MRFVALAVVAFLAVAQARDLSQYLPKDLKVWPKQLPAFVDPRIVNGEEAERHQFPYQCALFIDGGSFCGCSILDENTILTAAHCADGARTIEVVAGAHNINDNEATQQSRVSTNFIVHENWDPYNIRNDVALVVLSVPLVIDGKTVAPVSLYRGDQTLEGVQATVSGWGRPSDSSNQISPVLRHASNELISNSKCNGFYGIIQASHICLSGQGGRSSCNGDSGGPLVIVNGGEVQEVGVVSFGSAFGCGIGFPSAYSRVSSFADWIDGKRAALRM